jgi:hypothetical protein
MWTGTIVVKSCENPISMKFKHLLIALCMVALGSRAQISFTVSSNTQFNIYCYPSISTVSASSNYSAQVTYSWTGSALPNALTAPSITLASAGIYSVTASSGTVNTMQTFTMALNTQSPSFVASPTLMTLGSGTQIFTFTAASPTTNITHFFFSPGATQPVATGGQVTIHAAGPVGTYTHCVQNHLNGCITCQQVVVTNSTTGLSENVLEEPDQVFPNPNRGLFFIKTRRPIAYAEIYNVLGALVARQAITGISTGVDIRHHPAGVYWVKLIDGDHSYTLKLVKEEG